MEKTPNFINILKRVWDQKSQSPIHVYTDGSHNNYINVMGAGVILHDPFLKLTSTTSKTADISVPQDKIKMMAEIAEFYALYVALKLTDPAQIIVHSDNSSVLSFLKSQRTPKSLNHGKDLQDLASFILTCQREGRIKEARRANDANVGTPEQIEFMIKAHRLAAKAAGTSGIKMPTEEEVLRMAAVFSPEEPDPPPPECSDTALDIIDPPPDEYEGPIEGWGPSEREP